MLKKVYYVVVSGTFDRKPIQFSSEPNEKEIEELILKYKGTSARVETRYELN